MDAAIPSDSRRVPANNGWPLSRLHIARALVVGDLMLWWGVLIALTDAASVPRRQTLVVLLAAAGFMQLGAAHIAGLLRGRHRLGSLEQALTATSVWAVVALGVVLTRVIAAPLTVDTTFGVGPLLLSAPAALVGSLGTRVAFRLGRDRMLGRTRPTDATQKVIVFGAGYGGEQIIRAMLADTAARYVPVAILDDSPDVQALTIQGVPVVGTRDALAVAAKTTSADTLLIAVPSANSILIGELDDLARAANLTVRVLPTTSELLEPLSLGDIRELTEADLLGRAEVKVDLDSIAGLVTGKRVLVTGAGGSIGSELCRQLHRLAPSELMMLDRDESALHGVQLSIEGKALLDTPNLIVANIRDAQRVDEVFEIYRPEVVFHTAALKHLTLLENHPDEGHKTNTLGTHNLLEAAMRHDVERFVNVSTDKAADPTSVLGRTKRVAEQLTARAAERSGRPFVSVRFGNVLGSRGSVLPTFRNQIAAGGPITVTDPDVTRYFMTIPEAVSLVLQAGAIGQPGEIMILDMGEPVKIVDLAKRLIAHSGKRIDIHYTGLRPGEKMHEVLISTNEETSSREHPRILHTPPGEIDGEMLDRATSLSTALSPSHQAQGV